MRHISAPICQVRCTLELCISKIRDTDYKSRAFSVAGLLEDAEASYREYGPRGSLYKFDATNNVGALTGEEMVDLYDNRFSKKGHPAREIYDSLKAAAKFGICPLCGQRPVATLDHYLSKSTHPTFAITPLNLVPCCSDCNKAKLDYVAEEAAEQTFHPYFDNFSSGVWLKASVVAAQPPAVLFFTEPPEHWPDVDRARITVHFSKLRLAELYGANAAQEMAQIASGLREISEKLGVEAVRDHLEEQRRSREAAEINSWQAAFYTALVSSEWFWRGGHLHVAR